MTESGYLSRFEAVKRNDAGDAGANVGNAGKYNEGVLHVTSPRHKAVGNKDEDDGKQAYGPPDALHKHQSADLVLREVFFRLHRGVCISVSVSFVVVVCTVPESVVRLYRWCGRILVEQWSSDL